MRQFLGLIFFNFFKRRYNIAMRNGEKNKHVKKRVEILEDEYKLPD